ncbi:MAG TPA: hypothetical protein VLA85_13085, partial [Verrucomicrobiae bacterium]|nr:hypothetical protein [Verrucomicrobiae bacterium]
ALPVTTLLMLGLGAAYFLGRRRVRLRRRLAWPLAAAAAVVGATWIAGIGFWAARLADQIGSDIYQARHHYRLEAATVVAGIALPQGSWVSVDEAGRLYEIEAEPGAAVSIDGARWQGDIRLILPANPTASDRGMVKSATLAADATLQGTPCRAGEPVEFAEDGGELQHCTLAQPTVVAAEIADAGGGRLVVDLACAAGRDIDFRIVGHRLLEHCVLAEAAEVGGVACAGGEEIALSGDGLDACTLASAQRVGAFDLAAGTRIRFSQGRLSEIETIRGSAPLAVSGLDIPPGTTIALCDRSPDIDYLEVPEDSAVAVAGVKLTGRMNFDCGKFQYGSLFEDSVLGGRSLPRHASISREDIFGSPAPAPQP